MGWYLLSGLRGLSVSRKGVPKLVSGLISHSLQVINHYFSFCLQARLKYLQSHCRLVSGVVVSVGMYTYVWIFLYI